MPHPWMIVVGMHRSGTSALTGVLGDCGFQLPVDNMSGRHDNPVHHESERMRQVNDRLLFELGGRWNGPPREKELNEQAVRLGSETNLARRIANASFREPTPAAFKDPRTSLLIPFWSSVLEGEKAFVLIWRSPVEVASSLATRNDLPLPIGMALWFVYNQRAIRDLGGAKVLILRYEEILNSPKACEKEVREFCSRIAWTLPPRCEKESSLRATLRRERVGEIRGIPSEVNELATKLEALRGAHMCFEVPDLSASSESMNLVLELQRTSEWYRAAYDDLKMRRGIRGVALTARRIRQRWMASA